MVRRQLFNIVLLGLVLFAIAFAAAPWFAFRALKANARDQDVAGLSELVDFRALRTSLRAQVRAPEPEPAAAPDARPDIWRDPLGAMRRALEPLAEPLAPLTAPPARIEPYLTPEGLYDLTRGYEPGTAPPEPPPPEGFVARADAAMRDPLPAVRFWGINRVRFEVHPPERPAEITVLTFQRVGWFDWRLVHVRLPERDDA
ncbi:DUF2939 domain-containing protein [Phenylobacterium sp.]|uniref:DUF2939 domain-containing protein n=1 Tax=Phenylobacterium sp. TaxID=1871053 RepID=UPI0017D70808|nr:DUF2939 domain-containing protein [Phenylobacterium sp.]MBA4795137.1 DUF2939 domain-containing protein [Phenylobacterium sp.]